MPSTRVSHFVDIADLPEGQHSRALPPASAELSAPSDVADRADAKFRHAHPAKIGRPTNEALADAVDTVFEGMRRDRTPEQMAKELECTPERVKGIIGRVRTTMASRVDEYMDIHLVAAKVAAMKGDAEPAQWALENIKGPNGERVIDPPEKNKPVAPTTFNIGFALGGLPQQQQARQLPSVTVEARPVEK